MFLLPWHCGRISLSHFLLYSSELIQSPWPQNVPWCHCPLSEQQRKCWKEVCQLVLIIKKSLGKSYWGSSGGKYLHMVKKNTNRPFWAGSGRFVLIALIFSLPPFRSGTISRHSELKEHKAFGSLSCWIDGHTLLRLCSISGKIFLKKSFKPIWV